MRLNMGIVLFAGRAQGVVKTALDRNLNSYMDEVLICNYVLRYIQWGGRYGVFISSVRFATGTAVPQL